MILNESRPRSLGPLFAFIDLMFLLVAFFTLLLFFMRGQKVEAERQLERTQQRLEAAEQERSLVAAAAAKLEPLFDRFMAQQRVEAERRRELAAREARRRGRETLKLEYRIGRAGEILYRQQSYSVERFRAEVVAPARRTQWIAFRAYADAETPFGTVVESRRRLLDDAGEFDTYWDNVTREAAPREPAVPAR